MDRAYSTISFKAADDDSGVITGTASTPTPDRMDDIVVPTGAEYNLPISLLWQHNHHDPIGEVSEARVTAKGIEITGRVFLGVTDEIDRYWKLIKAGLVRGLSIGFRGLDSEQIEGSWGVRFKRWEWLELSAVTIPANSEATIATVKQYAARPEAVAAEIQSLTEQRAASGKALPVVKLGGPARVRAKPFVIQKIHTR